MKRSIPLWLAVAGWALTLGIAAWMQTAGAQEPEPAPPSARPQAEYPYLPAGFSAPYLPTVADWQAMTLNAVNASTTRISTHFDRNSLACILTPERLVLTMDLAPRPSWTHYQGGGKFTGDRARAERDLQAAVDIALATARGYLPGLKDEDVALLLSINSEIAGQWANGKLSLGAPARPAVR